MYALGRTVIRARAAGSVVVLAALLSGCNPSYSLFGDVYGAKPIVQPAAPVARDGYTPEPINLDQPAVAESNPYTPEPINLDQPAVAKSNPYYHMYVKAQRKDGRGSRNELASILMGRSDQLCRISKSEWQGRYDGINFGLGELATVLGGSAALVTGATAARVLGGTAGLTSASRAQINEAFYKNQLMPPLIQKVHDARATMRTALWAHFSETTDDYPVDRMISDVNRYNYACSLTYGFMALMRGTSATGDISDRIAAVKSSISYNNDQIKVAEQQNEKSTADSLRKANEDLARMLSSLEISQSIVGTGAQTGMQASGPAPAASGAPTK